MSSHPMPADRRVEGSAAVLEICGMTVYKDFSAGRVSYEELSKILHSSRIFPRD